MEREGQIGKSLPLQPRKLLYVWLRSHRSIPQPAMQFSSIFDYRLLAVISAQFHFTIWQSCYLCYLDLSGRSISSTSNLHVCISLGPFVQQRQSVRTVKEEGISAPRLVFTFDTRAHRSPSDTKVHLWMGNALRHTHLPTHMATVLMSSYWDGYTEKTLGDAVPLNTEDRANGERFAFKIISTAIHQANVGKAK